MAVVVGESLYRQGPVASQYMEGENEWTQPRPIATDAVVGSREGGFGFGPSEKSSVIKTAAQSFSDFITTQQAGE